MQAAALYGVLISLASVAFLDIAPQPAGAVVFWTLMAAQLIRGATLCWWRMRLAWAASSMLVGAACAGYLAVLAVSARGAADSGHSAIVMSVGWLTVALLFVESRRNPRAWQRWARWMEHQSLLDLVLARHIPVSGHEGRRVSD